MSCDRTSKLLDCYRLNMKRRGFLAVRTLILSDIQRLTELGAHAYAAEIREALSRLEDEAFAPDYLLPAYRRPSAKSFGVAKQDAPNSTILCEVC